MLFKVFVQATPEVSSQARRKPSPVTDLRSEFENTTMSLITMSLMYTTPKIVGKIHRWEVEKDCIVRLSTKIQSSEGLELKADKKFYKNLAKNLIL